MKLTAEQIHEIAGELETGMTVYVNRHTLEIRTVLNWDDLTDDEFWENEKEKINEEWSD